MVSVYTVSVNKNVSNYSYKKPVSLPTGAIYFGKQDEPQKRNFPAVIGLIAASFLPLAISSKIVKEPVQASVNFEKLPLFPEKIDVKSTLSAKQKLDLMAGQLNQHQLDAYYMPPEDEHLNLMSLPADKQRITWLTGFEGQNTSMLVTKDKMHLYYPDMADQFDPPDESNIDKNVTEVCKTDLKTPPDKAIGLAIAKIQKKIGQTKIFRVGYDPFSTSPKRLNMVRSAFSPQGKIELVPINGNLVDSVWLQRPNASSVKAFLLNSSFTGKNISEKLSLIRDEMKQAGAEIFPLTKLDEIGWLFNIRGGDVPYRPVVESYAIITQDKAFLFVHEAKVSDNLKSVLAQEGVAVKPYNSYKATLKELVANSPVKQKVLIDKDGVTEGTLNIVRDDAEIVEKSSPIISQKIIKNEAEIHGMQFANLQASLALIKHIYNTEQAFLHGKSLNEATLKEDLESKYAHESEFHELSFPTISALGANSYVGHHSTVDPEKKAQPGDLYMNDSGAQYTGGTTDTTRTILFGQPTREQIEKYTIVLKAHIACAGTIFPAGTTGEQLDAIGRVPLWQEANFDFEHSTGHGVGAFLNVHENPVNIGRQGKIVFRPGMVTSIEPSYYKKDWGGIRLENLYYVVEADKSENSNKKWYRFEHLTFVPFDKKLIDFSLLTEKEKSWLKDYYRKIWEKTEFSLGNNEKSWLKEQVRLPF